jgi:hypothetical protein
MSTLMNALASLAKIVQTGYSNMAAWAHSPG